MSPSSPMLVYVYLLILVWQVSVVEDERQESGKSDDENKANDGEPSSAETEPSNGKTNINDTPMDESQVRCHLAFTLLLHRFLI